MPPAVTVTDQAITGGSTTVAEAVTDGPGWLVIHAGQDGKPGPLLEYSPRQVGTIRTALSNTLRTPIQEYGAADCTPAGRGLD